ncbi:MULTISPECIES: oxygenase MpaB family protein [unclassified Nocardioides]|uniref:oxygenase MpaB family protein n=1 Tax=unclassified Nocardioides TaxID=2615069 RepID=UPI002664E943|nr:oxygenase MpaB family protein [Nocardioides sp. Arc9.136]WKN47917.1 oxygenase MpaB family protein [Nocardioides sp. Arc9.136]
MTTVRERLGQALFLRVAGPDGAKQAARIHGRPGPRWFEADSAIARVHGDASMFVGGIRALLLQTLHPAAMRAVSEHSGFRGDMWGRLARTSTFLAVTTFGHADDAQQAVDVVRRIHDRITGTMPDGTPYAASDPHLLRWVHVAEVDSFLLAHTTYGAEPLDQAGRDEYVAQVAEVGRRLGVLDPPTTEAELREALAAYRPELRGTPEAREAVRYLLFKPPLPLPARAPYGVLVAAAVGLMPAWTRRHLLLPWLPVSERTVVRVLGSVAVGTIRWALTPQGPVRDAPQESPAS